MVLAWFTYVLELWVLFAIAAFLAVLYVLIATMEAVAAKNLLTELQEAKLAQRKKTADETAEADA